VRFPSPAPDCPPPRALATVLARPRGGTDGDTRAPRAVVRRARRRARRPGGSRRRRAPRRPRLLSVERWPLSRRSHEAARSALRRPRNNADGALFTLLDTRVPPAPVR